MCARLSTSSMRPAHPQSPRRLSRLRVLALTSLSLSGTSSLYEGNLASAPAVSNVCGHPGSPAALARLPQSPQPLRA